MSKSFIISDLHLGHKSIAIKRGFLSVEEHDETIIYNWNKVVGKRDVVWILGDITMEKVFSYPLLDRMNGTKKVVGGNHDQPQHTRVLLKYVSGYCGMKKHKGMIFTHCPIHPKELGRFGINIHGHLHEKHVRRWWGALDKRYVNVSCEVVNYTPVEISTIKEN